MARDLRKAGREPRVVKSGQNFQQVLGRVYLINYADKLAKRDPERFDMLCQATLGIYNKKSIVKLLLFYFKVMGSAISFISWLHYECIISD
jgi:hypothetical protein